MKIIDIIKKQISDNKTIIYIKGTPQNPLCGFSAQAIHILKILKINFSYINVLENSEIRNELPKYSNWPTFPQLYYKKELIGGTDIITELYEKNKLKDILEK